MLLCRNILILRQYHNIMEHVPSFPAVPSVPSGTREFVNGHPASYRAQHAFQDARG